MSLVIATVSGDLRQAMEAEVRIVSAGLRRAVDRTGKSVKERLRAQARAGGFKDGGRSLANAWRQRTYPSPGTTTFNPASEIKTNMPEATEAFDKGAVIAVKGKQWLIWPTGFNATGGRVRAGGKGGMRITPAQMTQLHKTKQTFMLRSKRNPSILLWCIRVYAATGIKRGGAKGRGRLRLFVGNGTEVATGKVKGQAGWRKELLKKGFVPMFFMSARVKLRKRFDLEGVRAIAARDLAANIVAELRT